jgi:hypothetical protein
MATDNMLWIVRLIKMLNLQVESHLVSVKELPEVLASDILTASLNGSVTIVCEKPKELITLVKAEWNRLIHDIPKHHRRNVSFSAASLFDDIQATVTFATVRECKLLPPMCRTLYIACEVERQDMFLLTSWMKPQAQVVLYRYK